jgi:hypothetical protein
MPTWGWIVVAVAIVAAVLVLAFAAMRAAQTKRLRQQFGPEYDRAVGWADSRRAAEADLRAREERVRAIELRPLTPEAREMYTDAWRTVQAQFVDDPDGAVTSADGLIRSVMHDRGYPVEDFDQRAADISVDHPDVVENYREGHRLAHEPRNGDDTTEDRRLAMRHYRALFEELV